MLEFSKYNNRFLYFSSFLVFLIPFAQVTGPFLTDLIISTAALMYIFFILISNKELHENNKFLNILIVFWLYILITSLISEYRFLSLKPSLTFIRFIIFSFLVIYLIKNNKYYFSNFNIYLIIVLFIVVFDGYIQFAFGKNILGFEKVRPDRLSGFFRDELILGSFLSKFLPIILFLYYENRHNKKLKIFNTIIIFIMIPLIFLSGERSAFFLSLLFILLVLPIILSIKKFLLFTTIFSITAVVILNFSPTIHDRYVNQLKDHIVLEKNGGKLYFPEHIGLFNSSYNNFLNNKLIGYHKYNFKREKDMLTIDNEVSFEITKLGVNLYKYFAKGVEKYEKGILTGFNSETNQNKKEKYVNITIDPKDKNLIINGSSYKGKADKDIINTFAYLITQ